MMAVSPLSVTDIPNQSMAAASAALSLATWPHRSGPPWFR